MQLSKHNIVSRIRNSNDYFILNGLSGNADILNQFEYDRYQSGDVLNDGQYIEKGYVVNPEEEEKFFRERYLDFIDSRDTDEIQLFFVPTYSCNFKCSYCYQVGYTNENDKFNKEIIDSFFSYVNKEFADRKKYVTIFGGEPLMTGKVYKEFFTYFIEQSAKFKLDIAIVTNGYNLDEYLPVLSKTTIREIQVTLDGVGEVHDKRRPLHSGKGTFDQIVKGINGALEQNMLINLRMVVDKENIVNLPQLAQFTIDQGWTKSPVFKTQLGRNYELHYCQANNNKLYNRVNMYSDLYDIIKSNPHILEFHKPAYSISKFLFENGEMPDPLFDSCPGCKTEWAFDYTGRIYSCTATVGKEGEQLGTFFPKLFLEQDKIEEWQDRDVLSISACTDCNLRLACGGGCGSVAKNNNGELLSPDCRPVKELLELGISLYSELKI